MRICTSASHCVYVSATLCQATVQHYNGSPKLIVGTVITVVAGLLTGVHVSHLFCCMHPMPDQGPGCPLAVHSRHFRSRGDAWRHGACIQNMQRLLAQITSNVDVISLGLYWHFAPFMLFTNWTIDFVAFLFECSMLFSIDHVALCMP